MKKINLMKAVLGLFLVGFVLVSCKQNIGAGSEKTVASSNKADIVAKVLNRDVLVTEVHRYHE